MAINFPDSPIVGDAYTDVTSGITYIWDGTRWAGNAGTPPTSPTYVLTAGDTMTGGLTAPTFTATDHMEGVNQTTVIQIPVGGGSQTINIPGWVSRISWHLHTIYSSGTTLGADVAGYEFKDSFGSSAVNSAGTRYRTDWAHGVGVSELYNATSSASYFIPFAGIEQNLAGSSNIFRGTDGTVQVATSLSGSYAVGVAQNIVSHTSLYTTNVGQGLSSLTINSFAHTIEAIGAITLHAE